MTASAVNTSAVAVRPEAGAVSRRGGVDAMRLVSVFCVVWHHAEMPWNYIGPTGVMALTALSVAFTPRASSLASAKAKTGQRVVRLLLPWLIWSVVYAGLQSASAFSEGEPLFGWFTPSMLASGTWIHLWFLPFLFVMNLALMGVSLAAGQRALAAEVALGVALIALSGVWFSLGLAEPFHQWAFFMPGVAMGVWLRILRARPESSWALAAVALAPIAAGGLVWLSEGQVLGLEVGAGLTLAALGWLAPWRSPRAMVALGSLAMGVYLIHPIFLRVLDRVLATDTGGERTVVFVATLAASLVASAVLARLAPRVFGE